MMKINLIKKRQAEDKRTPAEKAGAVLVFALAAANMLAVLAITH